MTVHSESIVYWVNCYCIYKSVLVGSGFQRNMIPAYEQFSENYVPTHVLLLLSYDYDVEIIVLSLVLYNRKEKQRSGMCIERWYIVLIRFKIW